MDQNQTKSLGTQTNNTSRPLSPNFDFGQLSYDLKLSKHKSSFKTHLNTSRLEPIVLLTQNSHSRAIGLDRIPLRDS